MKKKVFVSVPTADGWIHKHVVFTLLGLIRSPTHETRIILPVWKPYENNLHKILNDFMSSDFDFWLNIDSDNPPIRNPLELVDLDKDIIGLPTPVWHFTGKKKGERPIYWNAYKKAVGVEGYNEWPIKEGLQRVDAVGTGCVLIARRVFEDMNMRMGPFQRSFNIDGTVEKGNDIAFCERAQKNGFEVWAHFDYPCLHFGELELNEIVRAFKGLGVK